MNLITLDKPAIMRNFPSLIPNGILSHNPSYLKSKASTTHNHNYLSLLPLTELEHHTRSHGMVGTQCEQVKNMSYMFSYASAFNSDLSRWNVSKVGG